MCTKIRMRYTLQLCALQSKIVCRTFSRTPYLYLVCRTKRNISMTPHQLLPEEYLVRA